MFRKILISTCVILYLNFVNCSKIDKHLHKRYEEKVIEKENSIKYFTVFSLQQFAS